MKLVVAIIRPEHRAPILNSINELGGRVVSLSQVRDGGTPVIPGIFRNDHVHTHSLRLRLDIAVNDEQVEKVVKAIGLSPGACHILVQPLDEWLRIASVEQGILATP
ncbi:MAG: hypothetical protein JWM11_4221 [Planctomycetaceae bacterium]|nr:hypothetical protein [Planctomycetaceae bacterium]